MGRRFFNANYAQSGLAEARSFWATKDFFKDTRATKIALVADFLRTLSSDARTAVRIAFAALDDLAVPPASNS